MSSGHGPAGGGASHSPKVLREIFENKDITSRLGGKHLSREYDLPYLGGYSNDGKIIYLDRHLPQNIFLGKQGRLFDPTPFLIAHESLEKAVIDVLGWNYDHAHEAATNYERRLVIQAGLNWKEYSDSLEPYIKEDEHEQIKKIPPDLDMTPYLMKPVNKPLLRAMKQASSRIQ